MTIEQKQMTGIAEAVLMAGSQARLAEVLGVSQQRVSKWVRNGWVPMGRILEIESQYGVSRHRLVNPRLTDLVGAGAE